MVVYGNIRTLFTLIGQQIYNSALTDSSSTFEQALYPIPQNTTTVDVTCERSGSEHFMIWIIFISVICICCFGAGVSTTIVQRRSNV